MDRPLSIVEERLGLTLVGKADLNLLKPLQALLEECHISRAAVRCGLSQSAMSRSLERLRTTFRDDLLVRFEGGFTRTARAEILLVELQEILPRLESALRADRFDPAQSRHTVRIATTEYGASLVVPGLVARLREAAPRMQIETQSWSERGFQYVVGGQVDLAIVSSHDTRELVSETLFVDTFACLVAKDHPIVGGERLTLEKYLVYAHVECMVADGRTPLIDTTLEAYGVRRRVTYRTANTIAGLRSLPGSDMIFTIPRRLAELIKPLAEVRLVEAPVEYAEFTYVLAYHPRLKNDALQVWIRQLIRDVAKRI